MDEQPADICPLCGRPLAGPCTKHHLVPMSEGGKGTTTVLLHKICHDKIHRVFTEKELKRKYFTIELIQSDQSIREFVKWIQKKEPEYYDRSLRQKK
ncbi:MAG: HNH endonuclease [Chitinophagaceae bacterium]|nr:MAG: HNH endonuclease [Chitinophagaceae bacterium]